jgi:hypothetical protein
MGTIDVQTSPDGERPAGDPGPVTSEAAPKPSGPSGGRPRPHWLTVLAVGIAAGLVAWLAGEMAHEAFVLPAHLRMNSDLSVSSLKAREQKVVNINNATLAFSLLGTVLGMSLGVAGGVGRRSLRAATMAGAVGLVAGGAAGLGMSRALVPLAERYPDLIGENLLFAILIHGGVWAAIAAAAGLAFGLGAGGWAMVPRAVAGGIVGAALGTALYDLFGALAFPLDSTSSPLSTTASTRLLARLAVAIPVALGAAWPVQDPRNSSEPTPVAPGAS